MYVFGTEEEFGGTIKYSPNNPPKCSIYTNLLSARPSQIVATLEPCLLVSKQHSDPSSCPDSPATHTDGGSSLEGRKRSLFRQITRQNQQQTQGSEVVIQEPRSAARSSEQNRSNKDVPASSLTPLTKHLKARHHTFTCETLSPCGNIRIVITHSASHPVTATSCSALVDPF